MAKAPLPPEPPLDHVISLELSMRARGRFIAIASAGPGMSDAIVANGQVYACVQCGGVFAEPPSTGKQIHCDPSVGGCGAKFMIVTYPTGGAQGGEPNGGGQA